MNVDNIKDALVTFGGVKRRFNETKVSNQVLVDDCLTILEKLVLQLNQLERNIHRKSSSCLPTSHVL